MTVMKTPDEEIISSLLHGNLPGRKAETEFFSRFAYFIQEGMKKYKLSEDEAFDAYSDSVLAVISSILKGRFLGNSSLKTYTFQIFQNKCVDIIRKKATIKNSVNKTALISDFFLSLSDATKSVLQQLSDKADFEALDQKIKLLGEKCRELLLFFANGYSDKEIAISLEYKTSDVVKTSRLRCLERLRQSYKNDRVS